MRRIFAGVLGLLIVVDLAYGQMWIRAVEVPCVVTDSSGKFVTDLAQTDFVIRDNGKKQKVTAIKEKLQAPLSVALLLDRSASVADSFSVLQSASRQFLNSVVRKNTDRSCLVAFDSHVYLLQDWTDDVESLTKMIGKLTPAGGTSLFDAIYKTGRDRFGAINDDSTKVIVLVTDGEDTSSRATFKQVTDEVSESGAIVYVLETRAEDSLNPREFQGKRVLSELKDMTGGELFYPKEGEKIEDLFSKIQSALRNQYIVTFTTYDEPDGKFHKLNLETTRKGLQVHTAKKGYFASS